MALARLPITILLPDWASAGLPTAPVKKRPAHECEQVLALCQGWMFVNTTCPDFQQQYRLKFLTVSPELQLPALWLPHIKGWNLGDQTEL